MTFGAGENTLRISPPLTITRERIDESLIILENAISEAEAEGLD